MCLVGVAALALCELRPPSAAVPDVPLDRFSAARAMTLLSHFADQPRPVGSQANARARQFLVEALAKAGAEVRVEKTTGIINRGRIILAGAVQNVVGTFHGRDNQHAIMLVAHYDSVSEGPGAADDGAGVISILETVRALRAGPVLRNDLIVLFTDGEEAGLLGAAGFVADHPDLANRVGLVVNLDVRGSSGPVLMFETSDQNGWLISQFARAVPYPLASSLMYAVYKKLPNDTDLTELKKAGVAGLNFAFAETFQDYHTRLDTRENLDPRSVQEMGTNVLALARHFGDLPRNKLSRPDAIYYDLLGKVLVVDPQWVVCLLRVAIFALLAFAYVLGRKRALLRFRLISLTVFPLLLLITGGGILLIWKGVSAIGPAPLLFGDTPSNQLLFAGFILIGLVCGGWLLRSAAAKFGTFELAAGMLTIVAILAAVVSYLLPGSSYLFQWPVLFGIGGLLLSLQTKQRPGLIFGALVAAIPAILILVPLIYLFFVLLDLNTILLSVVSILICLLFAIVWPLLDSILRPGRWFVVSMLLTAIALLVAGFAFSHPSTQHPNRDHLIYSLNFDQKKAKWLSYDDKPDGWTSQYLGASLAKEAVPAFNAGSMHKCLTKDAPVLPLAGPTAIISGESETGGIRVLSLHLTSTRGGRMLVLRLSDTAELLFITGNGRAHEIPVEPKRAGLWTLRWIGVPPEGVEITLKLRGPTPLKIWLADSSPGLPQISDQARASRPDYLMADTGSDVTVVTREYNF